MEESPRGGNHAGCVSTHQRFEYIPFTIAARQGAAYDSPGHRQPRHGAGATRLHHICTPNEKPEPSPPIAIVNEMADNYHFGPGETDDVTAIGLEIL